MIELQAPCTHIVRQRYTKRPTNFVLGANFDAEADFLSLSQTTSFVHLSIFDRGQEGARSRRDSGNMMFSRLRVLNKTGLPPRRFLTYSFPTIGFGGTRLKQPTLSPKAFSAPGVRIVTLRDVFSTIAHKLRSWANISLALALLGASGFTVFYLTRQQDVPFTGRKQFNCASLESTAKWEEENHGGVMMTNFTLQRIEQFFPKKNSTRGSPSYYYCDAGVQESIRCGLSQ